MTGVFIKHASIQMQRLLSIYFYRIFQGRLAAKGLKSF